MLDCLYCAPDERLKSFLSAKPLVHSFARELRRFEARCEGVEAIPRLDSLSFPFEKWFVEAPSASNEAWSLVIQKGHFFGFGHATFDPLESA